MRTLTIKNINNKLDKSNIKLLTNFSSVKDYGTFLCKKCDFEWNAPIRSVLYQNKLCSNCTKKHNKITVNEKLKKRKILMINNGSNTTEKCEFMCLKCNQKWKTIFSKVFYDNTGCPFCSDKSKLTDEKIRKKLLHKNIILSDTYKHGKQKTRFMCLACNSYFYALPTNLFKRKRGCPICNLYKNEKLTYKYLKNIFGEDNVIKNYKIICDEKINCRKSRWL